MRLLLEPEPVADLDVLEANAVAAHAGGLDGLLLRQAPSLPAPLIAAAALAGRVADLLLAVEVELGDRHPFELAEEAAVVDLASAGRLILVARPAPDAPDDYAEALDLLRTALTARPFRFEGARWRVPANLPENEFGLEHEVRLMPAPAQVRLEVWGAGGGREAALERDLGYLADADADPVELGGAHQRAAAALGPAAIGAPRARRETLSDPDRLVRRLLDGRTAFGQDWAVVGGGPDQASVGHAGAPTGAAASSESGPRGTLGRRLRMINGREIALANLTLLDTPPPGVVDAAAAAGFDSVTLRLAGGGTGDPNPLMGDTPTRRETIARLQHHGLRVLDVEVVRLREDTDAVECVHCSRARRRSGPVTCSSSARTPTRRARLRGLPPSAPKPTRSASDPCSSSWSSARPNRWSRPTGSSLCRRTRPRGCWSILSTYVAPAVRRPTWRRWPPRIPSGTPTSSSATVPWPCPRGVAAVCTRRRW